VATVNILLKPGSRGPRVHDLQWMLDHVTHAGLERDGDFGPMTEEAVVHYQATRHLHVDGVVGPATWTRLTVEYRAGLHVVDPVVTFRRHVSYWCGWFVSYAAHSVYSWDRPYPRQVLPVMRTDCSGSSSFVLHQSRVLVRGRLLPFDPNGLDWNGQGYTGTLAAHGRPVSLAALVAGDLIFVYPGAGPGGAPGHVQVALGGGRAFSFGSWPPKYVDAVYDGVFAARRYLG